MKSSILFFIVLITFGNFAIGQSKNVLHNEAWLFHQSVGGNLEVWQSYYFFETGKFVRLDGHYHRGNYLAANSGEYFYNDETNEVFLQFKNYKLISKNGETPKPPNLKRTKIAIKFIEQTNEITIDFYKVWELKKNGYFPLSLTSSTKYSKMNKPNEPSQYFFLPQNQITFKMSFQRKKIEQNTTFKSLITPITIKE